jgi:D-glycerate 3-kinase
MPPAPVQADPRLVDEIGRMIVDGPWERPALIGVAGAQGSGKTTLAKAAAETFGGVQISLDDVYLTRTRREAMAEDVHPLFATRGPPGTHDLKVLTRLIKALSVARPDDKTLIPDFDKLQDDRRPIREWRVFEGRPKAIIIDGWCLGAQPETAEELERPINPLERDRDIGGKWRTAVNNFVAGSYADLRQRLDGLLYLEAPAFEVVLDWRCQQEAELKEIAPRPLPAADRARLAGFIQHFERITRRMMEGGVDADLTVELDRNRRPVSWPR